MYIPTTWANPNKLNLIQEKKEMNGISIQKKKKVKKQNNTKVKIFETLQKPLALVRFFKVSSKSYSYE